MMQSCSKSVAVGRGNYRRCFREGKVLEGGQLWCSQHAPSHTGKQPAYPPEVVALVRAAREAHLVLISRPAAIGDLAIQLGVALNAFEELSAVAGQRVSVSTDGQTPVEWPVAADGVARPPEQPSAEPPQRGE